MLHRLQHHYVPFSNHVAAARTLQSRGRLAGEAWEQMSMDSPTPLIDAFFASIFDNDQEVIDYVQRLLALTCDASQAGLMRSLGVQDVITRSPPSVILLDLLPAQMAAVGLAGAATLLQQLYDMGYTEISHSGWVQCCSCSAACYTLETHSSWRHCCRGCLTWLAVCLAICTGLPFPATAALTCLILTCLLSHVRYVQSPVL